MGWKMLISKHQVLLLLPFVLRWWVMTVNFPCEYAVVGGFTFHFPRHWLGLCIYTFAFNWLLLLALSRFQLTFVNLSLVLSLPYSRLNYLLFGLRPQLFHLTNILLHAVVCILFTRICFCVAGLQRQFAFVAGAIFATHPIHSEAVSIHVIGWRMVGGEKRQPYCRSLFNS